MAPRGISGRTDEQIRDDVIEHLRWDGWIDADRVRVDVHEGTVELAGEVPSVMAHQSATETTRNVLGVRDVANRLSVVYPSARPVPTDEELQASAQSVLRWNGQIDAAKIRVSVRNGIVTLQGTVESYWQRTTAERLVRELEGVTQVRDELAVVPGYEVLDERIAQDIVAALERSAYVDADDVTVKVNDGHVTLSGTVSHWLALRSAYEAALYTPGVRDIQNNLKVAP